jgi:hypothetical protein
MVRVSIDRHRRWVNRDVAREPDRRARRWLWTMALGVFVACTPFAYWQLQQNECLRLSRDASRLRAAQQSLDAEARRLRAQRESLHSLESIERWAERRGLVRPDAAQVVVVGQAPNGNTEWLARNAARAAGDE